MTWNWQLPNWPKFHYPPELISQKERQFLLSIGSGSVFLKNIDEKEYKQFVVEILSTEGLESSRIEGEILDRESLQSSIKQHFGLHSEKNETDKESRMAKLLCDVYESFNQPLTHEMLWQWHAILFEGQSHIGDCGCYRTHKEPMQIVSHRYDLPKVFFEAPPSSNVSKEMEDFIAWFNSSLSQTSILGRAAVAHVYFESIHPFEDGNGRIGRLLAEKILSQEVGRPVVIAVSKILEKRKKEYYAGLETCNRSLEAKHWVQFFSDAILQAQEESMAFLFFLIEKTKMLTSLTGQLNPRQEKVLLRMFAEGLTGFKGGLTRISYTISSEDGRDVRSDSLTTAREHCPTDKARTVGSEDGRTDCPALPRECKKSGLSSENYIAITKTSKATATRDLTDLVQKGALVKTGELRHTRYWLNITSHPG